MSATDAGDDNPSKVTASYDSETGQFSIKGLNSHTNSPRTAGNSGNRRNGKQKERASWRCPSCKTVFNDLAVCLNHACHHVRCEILKLKQNFRQHMEFVCPSGESGSDGSVKGDVDGSTGTRALDSDATLCEEANEDVDPELL